MAEGARDTSVQNLHGSALSEESLQAVLHRLRQEGRDQDDAAKRQAAERREQLGVERLGIIERSEIHRLAPIAVGPELGRLLYMLTRAQRCRMIVEFGASLGVSTIHLAAALKDGGGGQLITTEIDPEKAAALQENLMEAQLEDLVEVRVGDALQTLRELQSGVDMLFLDGWNELYLSVLELVLPSLAPHALVIADLSRNDPDLSPYLARVRNPAGEWLSLTLPFDAGVEVSLRTSL